MIKAILIIAASVIVAAAWFFTWSLCHVGKRADTNPNKEDK